MYRHRRIISFSLWGEDDLYNVGAVENVHLAHQHYPGWTCRFYCIGDPPAMRELQQLDCEVVQVNSDGARPLFQRFLPATAADVERCLIRDCDSRLSACEAAAVQEWILSGKALHTLHDHELHIDCRILGGLWGVRGGHLRNLWKSVAAWERLSPPLRMGADQDYLGDVIWPALSGNHLGHTRPEYIDWLEKRHEVATYRPFPRHAPLEHGDFAGQCIPVGSQTG